ncbi:MAG: hypothetical protein LBL13_04745 [Bacteroidales bacterium]|nr:hypothetical protein [Bacteroidales bacterium]
MRKQSFYMTIITALLFCACNKREIFSPNRYIETEKLQTGASSLELVKQFTYAKKNQLTSVWLKDNNTTLTFEYNKDKTVKQINSSEMNNTCYAQLFYENKLVTHIHYYENNLLVRESVFSRKGKKNTINKIENYVYNGFSSKEAGTLSLLLFPETKNMPETVLKQHKNGEKELYAVLDVTYENDNISRVRLFYMANGVSTLHSTTTYTYDNKQNPYYGLPYAFMQLTGYNKNNEVYARTSYENDRYKTMITIESTYLYEKKYPTDKSVTESETSAVSFDANGAPKDWATSSKYSSSQYTYIK